jgi:CRP-like cAMP-binding protein
MISLDRLAALPWFGALPLDLRKKLAKKLREESFAAGQTIFSEGDPGGALYFLAEGRVAIQKIIHREQGLFKTLSVMGPGDFFGEMSLLEKSPRWASAVTLAPTVLLCLSAKELGEWLTADAPVPLRLVLPFVESLNARLRQTSREMILFFDVGSVLALNLESSALAGRLTDVLARGFDEPVSAGFFLWNEFAGEYDMVASAGSWADKFKGPRPPADPLFQWMEEKGECALVSNWPADDRFEEAARALWPPFKSLLAAPVLGDRLAVGHVVFGFEREADYFTPTHRRILAGVVNVVSPAFDSAHLRVEKRSRERLARARQSAVDF